jgi:hypothetical protein
VTNFLMLFSIRHSAPQQDVEVGCRFLKVPPDDVDGQENDGKGAN